MYSIPGLFPFNTRQNIMAHYRNLENWIIKYCLATCKRSLNQLIKIKVTSTSHSLGPTCLNWWFLAYTEGLTQTSNSLHHPLSMIVLYIFSIASFLIDHLFLHFDVSSEIWLVKETERIFEFQPYVHLYQQVILKVLREYILELCNIGFGLDNLAGNK